MALAELTVGSLDSSNGFLSHTKRVLVLPLGPISTCNPTRVSTSKQSSPVLSSAWYPPLPPQKKRKGETKVPAKEEKEEEKKKEPQPWTQGAIAHRVQGLHNDGLHRGAWLDDLQLRAVMSRSHLEPTRKLFGWFFSEGFLASFDSVARRTWNYKVNLLGPRL